MADSRFPLMDAFEARSGRPAVAAPPVPEEPKSHQQQEPPTQTAAETQTAAPVEQTQAAKELSDDDLLAMLAKRTGVKHNSIDDLKPKVRKTAEEEQQEREAKDQKALEWALGTNKIKKADHEKYIVDKNKDKRSIALQLFTNDLLEMDSTIEPAEAEERFKDYYREELDDKDPIRKLRMKEMNQLADGYLDKNYGVFNKLTEEFDQYQTTEQSQATFTKAIKEVADGLPREVSFSVPHTNPDGSTTNMEIKVPVDEATIKAVRKIYATQEMYNLMGKNGDIKPDIIRAEMLKSLKFQNIDALVVSVAKQYSDAAGQLTMAALKGIPNTRHITGGAQNTITPPKTPPTSHLSRNADVNRFR